MSLNVGDGYASGSYTGISEVYTAAGSGSTTNLLIGSPIGVYSPPTVVSVPKAPLNVIVSEGILMGTGDAVDSGAEVGDYVDNRGAGTEWDNISAVFESDDIYATVTLGADGVSKQLFLQGFDFNIPDDVDIAGIQIEVERSAIRGSIASDEAGVGYCGFYIPGWQLGTLTFVGEVAISPTTTDTYGIFFKPDGTKMYLCEQGAGDKVTQWTLSTPWDITTATYDSKSFYIGGQETYAFEVNFNTDGTRMYIMGRGGDDIVQYDLGTAWDVSTAVYNSDWISLILGVSGEGYPTDTRFKPDGTRMYTVGANTKQIYSHTLSVPWDVTTATLDGLYFDGTNEYISGPDTVLFKPDGATMFVFYQTDDRIVQYTLSTPWDVSTASYDSIEATTPSEAGHVLAGMAANNDGSELYMVNASWDYVLQFHMDGEYE